MNGGPQPYGGPVPYQPQERPQPARPTPTRGAPVQQAPKPHRGPMLLSFALIGLCSLLLGLPFCGLTVPAVAFSVVAWFMARKDLEQMGLGRMDRSGESLVRSALTISRVAVILTGIAVVLGAVLYAMMIRSDFL
jgi:hypothetical protein